MKNVVLLASTVFALLYLFVPLLIVVLFSFHVTGGLSFPFEGFSMRWYEEVLSSPDFLNATKNSFYVASATAAITLVVFTAAAYGMSRSTARLRDTLSPLFLLPITLPGIFIGVALLLFFARIQLPLSLMTVIIAHIVFVAPFFYLITSVALESLDPSLEEVALDLGASRYQAFFKIVLPQIWPTLVGATALAFMLSLDEFIITFFVIGNDGTLPMYIFSKLRRTVDPSINVVSALLIGASLLLWIVGLGMMWLQRTRVAIGVSDRENIAT